MNYYFGINYQGWSVFYNSKKLDYVVIKKRDNGKAIYLGHYDFNTIEKQVKDEPLFIEGKRLLIERCFKISINDGKNNQILARVLGILWS